MIVLYLSTAFLLVKSDGFMSSYKSQSIKHRDKSNVIHKYITSITEKPYHVLIAYTNLYCSGSLIRSRVVVSVSSCFHKWESQTIVVKVGSDTVTGLGQVIEVLEVKKHEYYGHTSVLDNDIALLMLKEHVIFSEKVKKITLIETNYDLEEGTSLDVSGWGSTVVTNHQSSKYENMLLRSEMTLLNRNDCVNHYSNLVTRSNFCVRYPLECRITDNGGSAVYNDMLVGMLSYGGTSNSEPYIALITNITYFSKWISLNAMRFLNKYCAPSEHYDEVTDDDYVEDSM